MFKKIAIKTGVLTTVFILAVIVSSYVTNRGNTDMSADMGGATLPRISFTTEGYEVNSLPGYKSDMTLTSMRDTLTPVTNNQYHPDFRVPHCGNHLRNPGFSYSCNLPNS